MIRQGRCLREAAMGESCHKVRRGMMMRSHLMGRVSALCCWLATGREVWCCGLSARSVKAAEIRQFAKRWSIWSARC